MSKQPLPNGSNGGGRDGRGRFAPGNSGGPGRPYARETARLRRLIREAVTDDDLRAIMRGMVDAAKGGDLAAVRELLNRLIGAPVDVVGMADLERHETNEADHDEEQRRFAEALRVARLDPDAEEG